MDAKEEVKARLSIEDVVAEYVELKRAGRNFKGLSPFSAERTPSFVVSPEKGIWHDFSSGRGGDMFSFVMEMEGMDFKQALEHLARKAGVDLSQYRGAGGGSGGVSGKHKERLFAANELAAKFYQVQFSRSKLALEYTLGKRKFSKETALEWQLGYSPNNGTALVDFLKSKGFKPDEIQQAGLTAGGASGSRYGSGLRDMFRGRLMIPLHDAQGRVIGFTARLLDEAAAAASGRDAPKYINTPQTALYDKSRHVYGLHLAKESIRKSKFVVMVEGNLDVISSHEAGVRQVVATAGTALTEFQLKALNKFTGDIRLSYDTDKAGLNATERAISVAAKVGVSISMITIPSGKDPDELIKQDPKLWYEVIEKHQYALDWLIERYQSLLDVTSAQGKREFTTILLPVVRGLADPVEQDHYLQVIAGITGVRQEALTDKYEQTTTEMPKPKKRPRVTPTPVDKTTVEHLAVQNRLLALTLMQPGLRSYLEPITSDMLYEDDARTLLEFLHANPEFTGKDSGELEQLRPIADYMKRLSLAYDEIYQDIEPMELSGEVARQQSKIVDTYVRHEKQIVFDELANADDATTRGLLERAASLDRLLRMTKISR